MRRIEDRIGDAGFVDATNSHRRIGSVGLWISRRGRRVWIGRRRVDRMLHAYVFGLLNALQNSADRLLGIVEPLGRPDSMDAPPHRSEERRVGKECRSR